MRLNDYVLNELSSGWGAGITFIDIDETIFQTKAMIYVMRGGQIVTKLSNQDFNTYKLKDGESFDFREFKDAELFAKTSIPIPKVVERIKRMFQHIDARGSKIILLTARADFDDRDVFLATFSNVGIPIHNIYVERTGNMSTGSVAARKKATIMKYLDTGEYRRVRLIDDDTHNLAIFLSLKDNLPQHLIDKVKEKYHITGPETIAPIEFYALQVVDSSGTLKLINSPVSEAVEIYQGLTNVIVALNIIDRCHRSHIDEGVVDSVASMVNKIKGVLSNTEISKNFELEKGLLSYIKDVGVGGAQILYHAFNAYYHKNEESKEKIKEISKSVKKEHLIDILMKLDVVTLHLVTGPLHVIEAVTGWGIMGAIKNKIEPVEKQAKQAINSLENLSSGLDAKLKSQFQNYANAIRRVFGIGDFGKVSETTAISTVGWNQGPDNLIGDDPHWVVAPISRKQQFEIDDFMIITTQKDWEDIFNTLWTDGVNKRNGPPEEGEMVKEDMVASVGPGTLGADIANPDTLIGGRPGEPPAMTRRIDKKKKKKRKSLEDVVNTDKNNKDVIKTE